MLNQVPSPTIKNNNFEQIESSGMNTTEECSPSIIGPAAINIGFITSTAKGGRQQISQNGTIISCGQTQKFSLPQVLNSDVLESLGAQVFQMESQETTERQLNQP